jgi:hypothetical protein
MKMNEKEFVVSLTDCNFDKACELVSMQVMQYYLDEDGHSVKISGWDRSRHSIKIEFTRMEVDISMGGRSNLYVFNAWVSMESDE